MKYTSMLIVLSGLFITGCATKTPEQPGAHLLSVVNAPPGSSYELGVYVLAPGDTVAKVCMRFEIKIRDFMAINPGLDPTRLRVGQTVRVYERTKQ
jgi:LysM repeat protein